MEEKRGWKVVDQAPTNRLRENARNEIVVEIYLRKKRNETNHRQLFSCYMKEGTLDPCVSFRSVFNSITSRFSYSVNVSVSELCASHEIVLKAVTESYS